MCMGNSDVVSICNAHPCPGMIMSWYCKIIVYGICLFTCFLLHSPFEGSGSVIVDLL